MDLWILLFFITFITTPTKQAQFSKTNRCIDDVRQLLQYSTYIVLHFGMKKGRFIFSSLFWHQILSFYLYNIQFCYILHIYIIVVIVYAVCLRLLTLFCISSYKSLDASPNPSSLLFLMAQ